MSYAPEELSGLINDHPLLNTYIAGYGALVVALLVIGIIKGESTENHQLKPHANIITKCFCQEHAFYIAVILAFVQTPNITLA